MSELSVTASTGTSGQPVLSVRGELDFSTTATLREPALAAVAAGSRDLTLDFADVSFLDSSGIGVLVEIRNAARERGAHLALRNAPPAVLRVVQIAGLTNVLGVSPAPGPVE